MRMEEVRTVHEKLAKVWNHTDQCRSGKDMGCNCGLDEVKKEVNQLSMQLEVLEMSNDGLLRHKRAMQKTINSLRQVAERTVIEATDNRAAPLLAYEECALRAGWTPPLGWSKGSKEI